MKVYDSLGPNPRKLRMFMLEKGIELPTEQVDILAMGNRQGEFVKRNPAGQVPALELDDGYLLGETVAIFGYLETKFPTPPLIGSTPEEIAITTQWQRRLEQKITENLYNSFRYKEGLEMFKPRMRCLPEAADGIRQVAVDGLEWLEANLPGEFIVGDRFTICDIILYGALDFLGSVGFQRDAKLTKVNAWFERIAARPSAEKSLHPGAAQTGFRG